MFLDDEKIHKKALAFAEEKTGYHDEALLLKSEQYDAFAKGAAWAQHVLMDCQSLSPVYFASNPKIDSMAMFTDYEAAENYCRLQGWHVLYRYSPTGIYRIYKPLSET